MNDKNDQFTLRFIILPRLIHCQITFEELKENDLILEVNDKNLTEVENKSRKPGICEFNPMYWLTNDKRLIPFSEWEDIYAKQVKEWHLNSLKMAQNLITNNLKGNKKMSYVSKKNKHGQGYDTTF